MFSLNFQLDYRAEMFLASMSLPFKIIVFFILQICFAYSFSWMANKTIRMPHHIVKSLSVIIIIISAFQSLVFLRILFFDGTIDNDWRRILYLVSVIACAISEMYYCTVISKLLPAPNNEKYDDLVFTYSVILNIFVAVSFFIASITVIGMTF